MAATSDRGAVELIGSQPIGMPIKVSVIVPVFNPGPYIDACLGSILGQSLGPEAIEAILVDDGSTDGTPERLDAYAVKHPNVRVIHQENSGWPGKPRNVGIEAARGEFLFFLDNDDTLAPEALERLVATAIANDADVVLGKMAGFHRSVPKHLFYENRPRASLADAPLMDGLTPHKLFRRSFVETHGLRFPEGRRRLEDHVFVVQAYFLAANISVLSDYVCYRHIRREDQSNAGLQRLDPKGYYGDLREVIGIVETHTSPGPLRDRLLERFARAELLGRLHGRGFLEHPDEYRAELFKEIRSVVADHIGPGVDELLSPAVRTQMELLRAGRLDLMVESARSSAELTAAARLHRLEVTPDRRLTVQFTAELRQAGAPFEFVAHHGQRLLPVPEAVAAAVSTGARTVDEDDPGKALLVIRRRDDWAELAVPATLAGAMFGQPGEGDATARAATATIDPLTVSVGRPIWEGTWDLFVRIEAAGLSRDVRLGADRDPHVPVRPTPVAAGRDPTVLVTPYWTDPGDNLSLRVTVGRGRPHYRRILSAVRRQLVLRLRAARPAGRP